MHITISGKLGSGKSTVCKILAEKYGFEIYSTGKIQRSIAAELGISTLEMNELMCKDNSYDYMIDDAVAKLSENTTDRNIIFDSRMAWHFAKNSFRVFMYVDPMVAAKRVFNDDRGAVEKYSSIEDANSQLLERSMNENRRFKEIYKVDNLDYGNYDMIIDASHSSPEFIAESIYENFTSFSSGKLKEQVIFMSPRSLYPIKEISAAERASDDDSVGITLYDHYNYVVYNTGSYIEALKRNDAYVICKNSGKELETIKNGLRLDMLNGYEKACGVTFTEIPSTFKKD